MEIERIERAEKEVDQRLHELETILSQAVTAMKKANPLKSLKLLIRARSRYVSAKRAIVRLTALYRSTITGQRTVLDNLKRLR